MLNKTHYKTRYPHLYNTANIGSWAQCHICRDRSRRNPLNQARPVSPYVLPTATWKWGDADVWVSAILGPGDSTSSSKQHFLFIAQRRNKRATTPKQMPTAALGTAGLSTHHALICTLSYINLAENIWLVAALGEKVGGFPSWKSLKSSDVGKPFGYR